MDGTDRCAILAQRIPSIWRLQNYETFGGVNNLTSVEADLAKTAADSKGSGPCVICSPRTQEPTTSATHDLRAGFHLLVGGSASSTDHIHGTLADRVQAGFGTFHLAVQGPVSHKLRFCGIEELSLCGEQSVCKQKFGKIEKIFPSCPNCEIDYIILPDTNGR
jgi:hypothetical protein